MTVGLRLVALFSLATFACASPTSPTASEKPVFTPVGDLEMVRCVGDSCDRFAFMLRNTGRICVVLLNFRGTVTLMKADGTTSTANWRPEDLWDRWFLRGETRRMVQDGGELKNPPGPHTYSAAVTSYGALPDCPSSQ